MKKIWPFLFYGLYYAAASGFFPYAALYYNSIGLSGAQIGLLIGLAPLVTLVGAAFFTGLADATRRHRLVISLTLIASIAWALVMPSVRVFALLLPLIMVYALVTSPIMSLGDNATMSMLGDQRSMYGRIRLGGTIGWGVMAYFSSLLIGRFGLPWMFWIWAVGMFLTLLVAQGLTFDKVEKQASFWSGMGTLLSDSRWVLFLATVLLAGVGMAAINNYQFVYMTEIGASNSLMGLSLTLSTISELPAMFFGDKLLKRFKPQGLLALGLLALGLRLLLYSAFNFPLAILVIQVIHGLTFPFIWIAGVSYAHENAPAGLGATAQGLFGAAMMGVGSGLGGFIGGLIIDSLGGRILYLIFGCLVLCGLMVFLTVQRRMPQAHVEAV